MKTYNYKWIDFLSNRNVIKITNESEFKLFESFLCQCGLKDILNDCTTFLSWQHLAKINNKNADLFLFEYENSKGLTWNDNIQKSIEWYGVMPIEVDDLKEFFEKKNLDCSINSNKEKKLCDLVEIEENNMECVILKIKENAKMSLIKLGCFEGNEQLIRVTKGKNNTYTIFTEYGDYSWYHGESGYTLVSESMDKKRFLINDCIENDFDIYIGKNTDLIRKSLSIHCLEDTYKNINDIKIMYWENPENESVVVHKNGEFFRAFSNVNEAKEFFKTTGHILTYSNHYVANTGCIVEEYKLVKEQYYDTKKEEINQRKDGNFEYDYE